VGELEAQLSAEWGVRSAECRIVEWGVGNAEWLRAEGVSEEWGMRSAECLIVERLCAKWSLMD
jgi:hypothetical protein